MSTSVATTTVVEEIRRAPVPAVIDLKQKEDFFWAYTEEPHRTRRQAIIKAHPEVHDFFPQFTASDRLTINTPTGP